MSKQSWLAMAMMMAVLLMGTLCAAQTQDPGPQSQAPAPAPNPPQAPTPPPKEGTTVGGFTVSGSLEFGGHVVGRGGNEGTYGTMVDLESGPRLLEQSLEMRALPGTGTFMDQLSLSSFGYGGDPDNVTRLRMSKDKWYDLVASFRRNRNFWDYNLLANPFNPTPAAVATFPQNTLVPDSPHMMELVRRMADVDLTLAPKSPVSVRLIYGYNHMYGSSGTTYHEGADISLLQPWNTLSNRFGFGVDIKVLPKTRISYDQYFDWFKYANTAVDTNFGYQLDDGIYNGLPPVDLGLVLERIGATSSQPCFNPISNAGVTPPAVSPTCQGYLSYARTNPAHYFYPTERISFQSNAISRLQIEGSFSYSGANVHTTFDESALTHVTRTGETAFDFTGPGYNTRITTVADFGVTAQLTDHIRFHDTFLWWDFRIPQSFLQTETHLYGNVLTTNPTVFDPTVCPANPAACPIYAGATPTASPSGFDLATTAYMDYFSQNIKMNLAEILVDLNKRVGARIGFRYRGRDFYENFNSLANETYYPGMYQPPYAGAPSAARGDCAAGNSFGAVPDPVTGICTVAVPGSDEADATTNEFTLVAGAWVRPINAVKLTFDMENGSSDDAFIRVMPRRQQQYKLRADIRPARWMRFNATMNLASSQAHWADMDYSQHNRNAGFGLSLDRGEWLTLDASYNYNNFNSNDPNVCFYSYDPATNVPVAPANMPVVTLATPGGAASGSVCDPSRIIRGGVPAMYIGTFVFDETVHTGSFTVLLRPVKRVTTGFGYTLTSSVGVLPQFDPNAPNGQNSINYHLPNVLLAVDVAPGWQLKGQWNYYDYNEKYPALLTIPRDFHANVYTLSARYSF